MSRLSIDVQTYREPHTPYGNNDDNNPLTLVEMRGSDFNAIAYEVWGVIFSFLPFHDIAKFLRSAKALTDLSGDIANHFYLFSLKQQQELFLKLITSSNFYNYDTDAFRHFVCVDSIFSPLFYAYVENPLAGEKVHFDRTTIKKIVDAAPTIRINDEEIAMTRVLEASFERAVQHSKEVGVKLHPRASAHFVLSIFLLLSQILTWLFFQLIAKGQIQGNVSAALSFAMIASLTTILHGMCIIINYFKPGIPALRWFHPIPDFNRDSETRETSTSVKKKFHMACSFFREVKDKAAETQRTQAITAINALGLFTKN